MKLILSQRARFILISSLFVLLFICLYMVLNARLHASTAKTSSSQYNVHINMFGFNNGIHLLRKQMVKNPRYDLYQLFWEDTPDPFLTYDKRTERLYYSGGDANSNCIDVNLDGVTESMVKDSDHKQFDIDHLSRSGVEFNSRISGGMCE